MFRIGSRFGSCGILQYRGVDVEKRLLTVVLIDHLERVPILDDDAAKPFSEGGYMLRVFRPHVRNRLPRRLSIGSKPGVHGERPAKPGKGAIDCQPGTFDRIRLGADRIETVKLFSREGREC
jgi:hypothetical protein